MKTNGDIIIEAIHKNGIEKVRELVYGKGLNNFHNEVEGMRKFIESRQDWCKDQILNSLSI